MALKELEMQADIFVKNHLNHNDETKLCEED